MTMISGRFRAALAAALLLSAAAIVGPAAIPAQASEIKYVVNKIAIIAALAVHDWTTCWIRRIATRGCHVRNQRAPRAITPVSRVSMAIDVPAVGKRGPPVDAATFATHGTSGALPPARDGTKG